MPHPSDTSKVSTTVTVNGHALSSNVTVSASDLTTGTLPHAQLPTLLAADIPNNNANTSGTATYANDVTGGSANQILYQSAVNSTSYIAAANNAVLVSGATGIPTMSTTLPTGLSIPNALSSVSATISAAGTTQGTATTLTSDMNVITTVAATSALTVIMPAQAAGKSFTLILVPGAYVMAFSGVYWMGTSSSSTAPAITASKINILSFFSDGTNWYGFLTGAN